MDLSQRTKPLKIAKKHTKTDANFFFLNPKQLHNLKKKILDVDYEDWNVNEIPQVYQKGSEHTVADKSLLNDYITDVGLDSEQEQGKYLNSLLMIQHYSSLLIQ